MTCKAILQGKKSDISEAGTAFFQSYLKYRLDKKRQEILLENESF
jgi:hypothetical protein